jgi:hypothetical protein
MAVGELFSYEAEPEGPGWRDYLGGIVKMGTMIASPVLGGAPGIALALGGGLAGEAVSGGGLGDILLSGAESGGRQAAQTWQAGELASQAAALRLKEQEEFSKRLGALLTPPTEAVPSRGLGIPGRGHLRAGPGALAEAKFDFADKDPSYARGEFIGPPRTVFNDPPGTFMDPFVPRLEMPVSLPNLVAPMPPGGSLYQQYGQDAFNQAGGWGGPPSGYPTGF